MVPVLKLIKKNLYKNNITPDNNSTIYKMGLHMYRTYNQEIYTEITSKKLQSHTFADQLLTSTLSCYSVLIAGVPLVPEPQEKNVSF